MSFLNILYTLLIQPLQLTNSPLFPFRLLSALPFLHPPSAYLFPFPL